ncbi:intraflagellar transport protein 20 homolog isoform 1-T2 [Spheniscus humboldti]
MAQAALGAAGLHFDELNKLRVLDPEAAQQTARLREECGAFLDRIVEFQKIVGSLIELVDQLAKAAETEKMKAIGARNLLKSIAKQREAQEQQLQALIAEKKMQLERSTSEDQDDGATKAMAATSRGHAASCSALPAPLGRSRRT